MELVNKSEKKVGGQLNCYCSQQNGVKVRHADDRTNLKDDDIGIHSIFRFVTVLKVIFDGLAVLTKCIH